MHRRQDDIAEAVERIVPRRQLILEPGDLCIGLTSAGLKLTTARQVYAMSEQGSGPLPGLFTTFEHALAAGDDLARARRVRLFYQDSPGGSTQLLRDYRPK